LAARARQIYNWLEVRDDSLDLLVRELLLARTEGLDGPRLAAFVDGWSSLLDLVRRTDLLLPQASQEVAQAVSELVLRIRDAQDRVLAADD
jgi:hypothetical protein